MNPRLWKVLVVVLSVSVIFSFTLMTEAHSRNYSNNVEVMKGNAYNGSLISVFAEPGYNVNGLVQVGPENQFPPDVTFQNGTTMTLNTQLNLSFHFTAEYFQFAAETSIGNSPLPGMYLIPGASYPNISGSNPIGISAYGNVSAAELSQIHYFRGGSNSTYGGNHVFSIYISGDAYVNIRAVGVAF